ncbi:hypothetical protein P5Y53_12090 [Dyella jiangningensis]|uniref:hypothetical protein n=1 Tax=Dyella jiangningensis TaxID=1379159 RepID=UPI00240F1AE0|nr:hypothetical protein [Dyella jiangningensis]MDG2538405.1 hypothetical protein [Dyella jiangningensis]
MSDTIDLLESIGKNAALRHASAEELAEVLSEANASEALLAAVKQGDSSLLSAELGHHPLRVNHDAHTGGHEDESPDGEPGEDPGDVPADSQLG